MFGTFFSCGKIQYATQSDFIDTHFHNRLHRKSDKLLTF